ncbi:UNVERIFIED_CONTAM: hypothetical protein GTU68_015391 [Idotea baltica]|nr:hypothetical protein [Idotea baltica]
MLGCGGDGGDSSNGLGTATGEISSTSEFGQRLFFDVNLSSTRTQSCATCHNPDQGLADSRDNGIASMVSLGADGQSLGKRNAPTLSYAAFTPTFTQLANGQFRGGQFLDGRANDLASQAINPILGADEMGLGDNATLYSRILENEDYTEAVLQFFGAEVVSDESATIAAVTQALAEFQMGPEFVTFDSKYDRFLADEYEMTDQESLGRSLFFSAQFANCSQCHQLRSFGGSANETFSNYEYENIGVPRNDILLSRNGNRSDRGLAENPAASSEANVGKFRTPTLRNVAVTGPYMHNGVFADLRTVILFYDKFNNSQRTTNPETLANWRSAEYPSNVNLPILESAPALSDGEVDALVAFLKTLTDKRFEQ